MLYCQLINDCVVERLLQLGHGLAVDIGVVYIATYVCV